MATGTVKWFNGAKGFGFIQPDEGGPDVFVHISAVERAGLRSLNEGQKITYELVEAAPPRRHQVRIADPKLPFGGTWTFQIEPAAGGSELRITEDGEIYNVIFRFMARFFFGYTATLETYLRDLGAKFGQPVEIEE